MLRWVGHDAVAVLDGGLAKWLKEGRPVTAEIPRIGHNPYPARMRANRTVGAAALESAAPNRLLLDARAPARFRGEQEPIDRVAGHIPGAQNRFCNENVDAAGVFKSPTELRKEFDAILKDTPASEVVNYCGSGVAACHNVLAMEVAGLPGAKLYAGSWSDWISDPNRPIGKGAAG
jgi:thiosulfate/3-mercaptopyruvate sulfurtransferase